jgi:DNA-binding transcriptional LysR family regulator
VELRDLESFELIARLGHMGQAGAILGRSQPALTKCVWRLEAEFGTKLFARSGRLLKLTEAGQLLLANVVRLRSAATEAKRQIADVVAGAAGLVRVGTGQPGLDDILSDAFADVLQSAPGATFQLTVGLTTEMLQNALLRGEIDLRIGPLEEPVDPNFEFHVLWYDETVIAAGYEHPLARRKNTLADLTAFGWALPTFSTGSRKWVEQLLAGHALPPPHIVLEANVIQNHTRSIVKAGLLTAISRRSLAPERLGGHLVELQIPDAVLRRPFGVIWRREGYFSAAAHRFIAALTKASRQAATANRQETTREVANSQRQGIGKNRRRRKSNVSHTKKGKLTPAARRK